MKTSPDFLRPFDASSIPELPGVDPASFDHLDSTELMPPVDYYSLCMTHISGVGRPATHASVVVASYGGFVQRVRPTAPRIDPLDLTGLTSGGRLTIGSLICTPTYISPGDQPRLVRTTYMGHCLDVGVGYATLRNADPRKRAPALTVGNGTRRGSGGSVELFSRVVAGNRDLVALGETMIRTMLGGAESDIGADNIDEDVSMFVHGLETLVYKLDDLRQDYES